jgi:predicted alpha/beta hydrolase family esterase
MYNVAMHTKLPVTGIPFSWFMHWSNILETDLSQARLVALTNKNKPKRR